MQPWRTEQRYSAERLTLASRTAVLSMNNPVDAEAMLKVQIGVADMRDLVAGAA